jgi:hypothetical protein
MNDARDSDDLRVLDINEDRIFLLFRVASAGDAWQRGTGSGRDSRLK